MSSCWSVLFILPWTVYHGRQACLRRSQSQPLPLLCPSSVMPSDSQTPSDQVSQWERAVRRHNDIGAMINLGNLFVENEKYVSFRKRGVELLERAIKQAGHPYAMYSLAAYLLRGKDKEEHRRAFLLLEQSLKIEESTNVLARLSYCYLNGVGVARNAAHSVQICERALRLDRDAYLIANLGRSILEAPTYYSQRNRAVSLYREAIRLSKDSDLMNDLGLYYQLGNCNLRKSSKRAAKWYRRAIRQSKYPPAMCNLAGLILDNDPTTQEVQQAIDLLEQALELEEGKDEVTIFMLADVYSRYCINIQRAFGLFEMAATRFGSTRAISTVLRSFVCGIGGVYLEHTRMFHFCATLSNNNQAPLRVLCAFMLWTGANNIAENRTAAIGITRPDDDDRHGSSSLILRHDLESHPAGKKHAQKLMDVFDESINRLHLNDEEAIILSEKDKASDKQLALESFRAQRAEERTSHEIAWIWPNLRKERYRLPFGGYLDCFTNPLKKFALWTNLVGLNMASLLLEIEGKEAEAIPVLEELMETELKLIAMLNLAFILSNGVAGIEQDMSRAMQLLEDAVEETNDPSARAMLANALSEREESSALDVDRGFRIWQSVVAEENDENELKKVQRLISCSSTTKWSALE